MIADEWLPRNAVYKQKENFRNHHNVYLPGGGFIDESLCVKMEKTVGAERCIYA